VLVRHLIAIENLGSMDVLCTDKTGTLTEGVVKLDGAWDMAGKPSSQVLALAAINAALETGLPSALDDASLSANGTHAAGCRKLAEIPFDFVRKRVSVVVEDDAGIRLVTKGAFSHVLEDRSLLDDGTPLESTHREAFRDLYDGWSSQGIRVLAVASCTLQRQISYSRDDEKDLRFAGFLTFIDSPKEGAAEAIAALASLGVEVKLITGDGKLVSQHVARLVGLPDDRVLTGAELDELHDEALWHAAERTALFVEVDPSASCLR
jgi:Mg2+-importing ATPase